MGTSVLWGDGCSRDGSSRVDGCSRGMGVLGGVEVPGGWVFQGDECSGGWVSRGIGVPNTFCFVLYRICNNLYIISCMTFN